MTDEQLNKAIHRLDLALQEFLDEPNLLRGERRTKAEQIASWLHELLTERETRRQKR